MKRDYAHYLHMFADAETVGASLAAKGLCAARYGEYDLDKGSALRTYTRYLLGRYGATLTGTQALFEITAEAARHDV